MNSGNRFFFPKSFFTDALYFWLFWIGLPALLYFLFGSYPERIGQILLALALPQLIPVTLIGLAFEWFLNRKKILLFLLVALPLCWGTGLLQNQWFTYIIGDKNVHVNNEILIFLILGLFTGFRYIRIAAAQRRELQEAENKRVLAELQLLRAQLNPHFMFNALNSIYSLIITQSPRAGDAVLSLSELMRFHIDSSGSQLIPLEQELNMIRHYVELEKLKSGERCRITLEVNGDTQHTEIAPLILLPFVENAFKHGMTDVPQQNFVSIELTIQDDEFRFRVVNSLPQKQAQLDNKQVQVGIENTRKRLALHYKGAFSLHTGPAGNRYETELFIRMTRL